MHYEQYVVAVTDTNGKSFREFESEKTYNGRKSKVFLPFDSEYKLLIKNNSDRRIKLSIDIDGTTVSGRGLIMSAYETDSIERFVDVARKFKFVRKNDERVSDPTSVDNGFLRIRIEKEVAPTNVFNFVEPQVKTSGGIFPRDMDTSTWIGTNMNGCITTTTTACNYSSGPISHTHKCSFAGSRGRGRGIAPRRASSEAKVKSLLNEQSGATVEGNASSQIFTTTIWNGTDGPICEFIFRLLGQQGVSDQERLEYEKYLELKKKFGG